MKSKSVIFIKYSPLTKTVYDDFCLASLADKGFQVEYWDVTKLFGLVLTNFETYKPEGNTLVRTIESYDELNVLLSSKKDSLCIILMTCRLNQFRLLSCCSKNQVRIAFWGPAPLFTVPKSLGEKLKGLNLSKIRKRLEESLMHLLLRLKIIKYYDYYFSVGEYGYSAIGISDKKLLEGSVSLPINSFDYNRFLYDNENSKLIEKDYILFIDQYFPYHPDLTIVGANSSMPAEQYYYLLNRFFAAVEKKTKMPVVIAAHPKALKYKQNDFFEARRVVFNKTCALVKDAKIVLAHSSTSIYYAIMAKKPIILLNSDLIREYMPAHEQLIKSLSERFNLKVESIDHNENDSYTFSNDELLLEQREQYESFIFEYCTSSTIHQPNQDLLNYYLSKILAE